MNRLQKRIGELRKETEDVRTDLLTLHKERTRLEKEREVQRGEISSWTERINECQLLKFGRLVDLDELEQGYDKTKEEETTESIKQLESKHDSMMVKMARDKEDMKDQIAEVMLCFDHHT